MAENGNEQNPKSDRKNCFLLPFVLLGLVGGGFSLELIGYLKLDPFNRRNDTSDLCRILPSSKSCTFKPENEDVLPNSTRSRGEAAFLLFSYTQGQCIFFQFISINFILPHIICCFRIFCHWCLTGSGDKGCIECCFLPCIHWAWIILEGWVGISGIISCSILGVYLPTSDIRQIDGFFHCLSNGLFGICKCVGYIIYHKKVGFPSGDYFYGCDYKFSRIEVRLVGEHIKKYKYTRNGRTIREKRLPIYSISYH
ncbi:uncharacterized protein [Mytilus edulis]|uniref:uncharacterized protein n=1 Tax=Mytilus edulis TaxID=6550 RepID=UPI0039EFD944